MKKQSEPRFSLPPQPARLAKFSPEPRRDSEAYTDETCRRDLSQQEFFECTFTGICFSAKAAGCLFADAVFDHCDFSNCNFTESVFRRAVFLRCRMTGTDFSASTFQDVRLDHCQANYANFNASKWKICALAQNSFAAASFSSCRFQQLSVDQCVFSGCEFLQTPLAGINLSTSQIDGISVTPDSLQDVIVNQEQAIACAKLLGIHVI